MKASLLSVLILILCNKILFSNKASEFILHDKSPITTYEENQSDTSVARIFFNKGNDFLKKAK